MALGKSLSIALAPGDKPAHEVSMRELDLHVRVGRDAPLVGGLGILEAMDTPCRMADSSLPRST